MITEFFEITDDQSFPWFCNVYHRPAEYRHINGWGPTGDCWTCPECNEIIEKANSEDEEELLNG